MYDKKYEPQPLDQLVHQGIRQHIYIFYYNQANVTIKLVILFKKKLSGVT